MGNLEVDDIQPGRKNYRDMNSCPNCGTILTQVLTRTRKCLSCKETIYVRSKQTLYSQPYLTREQAHIVDALKDIEWRNVTIDLFKKESAKLSKEFGQKAGDGDTLWRVYHNLLGRYARVSEFDSVSWVYSAMASYLSQEGKDSKKLQAEAKRAYLMWIKQPSKGSFGQHDDVKVLIDVPDFECVQCKKQAGKQLGVDVAIKEMPLPCDGCVHTVGKNGIPYCVCEYVAIYD